MLHKTFHSYTVRAKQGGSQAGRDSRSATKQCRSAGASLRRYNEASLVQVTAAVLSVGFALLGGISLGCSLVCVQLFKL